MDLREQAFIQNARRLGIDTKEWGKNGSLPLDALIERVGRGECEIVLEGFFLILRTQVVRLHILASDRSGLLKLVDARESTIHDPTLKLHLRDLVCPYEATVEAVQERFGQRVEKRELHMCTPGKPVIHVRACEEFPGLFEQSIEHQPLTLIVEHEHPRPDRPPTAWERWRTAGVQAGYTWQTFGEL